MVKNNLKCALCGASYTYCPNCKTFFNEPVWRQRFDEENCKKIYFACANYRVDKNVMASKRALESCDLSKMYLFNETIQNDITEILSFSEPNEEPVMVEESVIEDNMQDNAQENNATIEVVENTIPDIVEELEMVTETETVEEKVYVKKNKKKQNKQD